MSFCFQNIIIGPSLEIEHIDMLDFRAKRTKFW